MDQSSIRVKTKPLASSPVPSRSHLWVFETDRGQATVDHEYFLTTLSEWNDDERSHDSSWETDLDDEGRLYVHRLSLTLPV